MGLALRAHAEFMAGAAVRVVTPDPLLPVSGGVGPSRPTQIRQGDLTVRALALSDGRTGVAIVSGDFLGFPSVLGNRVRARIPFLPPQNILIAATHTHSAPDCYGFPDEQGKTSADLKYLETVCDRMAEAVREAWERKQPARLRVASGELRGRIAYNAYVEKFFNPQAAVLQFRNTQDQPIALLLNYAVHPEVLGSDRGILSPDLCGPFYDWIQEHGGGTALFLNGAQGGMVTADNRTADGKERGDWEECRRIGSLMAEESFRLLQGGEDIPDPSLYCTARYIRFPVDSPLLRQIMTASPLKYTAQADGSVAAQCNLIHLGSVQILTIPGEALPNIGRFLQRHMRGRHNLLFGLTNDALGYMLSRADWASFKVYQYVSRVCLGERTGEILMDEALRLIEQSPLPGTEK